ncbi:long-chain fatty acid transporter [Maudiozyma humilis]|uniref:Long-chain fatty acid transporter n=1 Tax=Maudiozyma humilis TaxID=51915 RepID=A0AAV5S2B3_MAUHU|nr:long-chain fatty acid transporter [Kazachstania humilis]
MNSQDRTEHWDKPTYTYTYILIRTHTQLNNCRHQHPDTLGLLGAYKSLDPSIPQPPSCPYPYRHHTTHHFTMVSQLFEEKAKAVNTLPTKPNTEELLRLYALYKQATVGDVNTERPGIFNIRDRSKWDAWNKVKGLAMEEAEQQYIALVDELFEKYK